MSTKTSAAQEDRQTPESEPSAVPVSHCGHCGNPLRFLAGKRFPYCLGCRKSDAFLLDRVEGTPVASTQTKYEATMVVCHQPCDRPVAVKDGRPYCSTCHEFPEHKQMYSTPACPFCRIRTVTTDGVHHCSQCGSRFH